MTILSFVTDTKELTRFCSLSFYKEELVGEKKNYIYIRATTDQKTPIDMLRLVADEVVACGDRIELLIGDDPELMEIWRSFQQVCQLCNSTTTGTMADQLGREFWSFTSRRNVTNWPN